MPQFLLMIKKRNWDHVTLKWLQPGEIQADPLGDLRTSDGNLSVWHIDADKSNLDLVITALAANRDRPDKFEYGLFDQKTLNGVKIKILRTPGRTPIDRVNFCHRDLSELTIDKAAKLAKMIFTALQKERLVINEVQDKIISAVDTGRIDLQNVSPSMREKIEQLRK